MLSWCVRKFCCYGINQNLQQKKKKVKGFLCPEFQWFQSIMLWEGYNKVAEVWVRAEHLSHGPIHSPSAPNSTVKFEPISR